jgi:hypothetical protein
MHCRASPAEIKSTVHDAMHYVLRSLCQSKGALGLLESRYDGGIVLVALPPTRRGGWWGECHHGRRSKTARD